MERDQEIGADLPVRLDIGSLLIRSLVVIPPLLNGLYIKRVKIQSQPLINDRDGFVPYAKVVGTHCCSDNLRY